MTEIPAAMPRAADIVLSKLRKKTGCTDECVLTVKDAGSLLSVTHNGQRISTTPTMKAEHVINWLIEKVRDAHA